MSAAGLRRLNLLVVIGVCVGVPAELVLTEHWGSPPQIIPFVLCAFGALAAGWALVAPGRPSRIGLRAAMALLGLGSLFGTFEHIEHNAEFAAEIDAGIGAAELVTEAITGANPALAPLFLLVAVVLGVAASSPGPDAQ